MSPDHQPVDAPLAARWTAALGALNGRDPGHRTFAAVHDAYREPHRRYHDQRHLRAVVRGLAAVHGNDGDEDEDGDTTPVAWLVLAAFYHDVVYDPRRSDNEALSAQRALAELTACGLAQPDAESVAEAVAATAHLGTTGPHPAGVGPLLDADLSVLGAPRDHYRRYAAEVRAEYAHVDDAGWRTGRAEVLRTLADQELFVTPAGRARHAAAARRNLRWELDELAVGRIPGWPA